MVARSGQLQAGMFGLKGDRPLPRPGVVGRLVEGASMLLQIIWEWGLRGRSAPAASVSFRNRRVLLARFSRAV